MKTIICILIGGVIGFGLGQCHKSAFFKQKTENIEKVIKETVKKNANEVVKNISEKTVDNTK